MVFRKRGTGSFCWGIRADLPKIFPGMMCLKHCRVPLSVQDAIGDLPKLHGGLSSPHVDSWENWQEVLEKILETDRPNSDQVDERVKREMEKILTHIRRSRRGRGSEFTPISDVASPMESPIQNYFHDRRLGGLQNYRRGYSERENLRMNVPNIGLKNMNEVKDYKATFQDCPPRADAIMHSLRAFGYDLAMALADLVDNSIFAKATKVWISYDWNDGYPWVRILDNGRGMDENQLVNAMRLGSKSPLEDRDPTDLGRFGLGLKTASFSQCKLVTVYTKISNLSESVRYWDLDYIQSSKSWMLGKIPEKTTLRLLEPLRTFSSGTLVLWQNLDRLAGSEASTNHNPQYSFQNRFLYVKQYLEMVFHRYLADPKHPLMIQVGAAKCEPWDPYLLSNNYTQELSSEKYESDRVSVTPYVLPHVSKRTSDENERGGGPKGWNGQQGFYIYRNKRLIVPGGYLDFHLKQEEHFKLARIRVDISNDMDREWSIDVRKAVAAPPDNLRSDLLRVAQATRKRAAEVYRTRTGIARKRRIARRTDVWLRQQVRDKIIYKINLEHPVVSSILKDLHVDKKSITKLFYVIEHSVPHQTIILDGNEHEDCYVDLPADLDPPPDELLQLCREFYRLKTKEGRSHEEAVDLVCSIEPFDTHPLYRANLDKQIGG